MATSYLQDVWPHIRDSFPEDFQRYAEGASGLDAAAPSATKPDPS